MGPLTGHTICGHIHVDAEAEEELGASAFGRVLSAHSSEVKGELWLAVIDRKLMPTQVDLSRFMAGANALTELRHPALVRTALIDREADFAVVGYEALPGAQTLTEVIERDAGGTVLDRAAVELARGLAYLHRKERLHGALAPGSVVLWEGVPMLWQYGLAELCSTQRFCKLAAKVGGDVVAPEVRAGGDLDARADVYAWGVLVAGLASGCVGAEAVMAFQDGAADFTGREPLRAIAERALSDDPAKRPESGAALLRQLLDVPALESSGPMGQIEGLARRYLEELEHSLPGKKPPPTRSEAPFKAPPLPPPPAADDSLPPGAVIVASRTDSDAIDPFADFESDAAALPSKPEGNVAAPDESTPPDGARLNNVLEEERQVQAERERKRAELAANKAKWGKAPPPIQIKPQELTPLPGAAPRAAASPRLERKPTRPDAAVDRMGKSKPRKKPKSPRPTPKEVDDSAAGGPVPPSQSDMRLELDTPFGPRQILGRKKEARNDTPAPAPATGSAASASSSWVRPAYDVTRTPGPHGPPGALMAAGVGLVATGLALWATVAAAGAGGGMADLLGLRTDGSDKPESQVADAKAGAATGGRVAETDGETDARLDRAGVAECPEETVEIDPSKGARDTSAVFCIDVAEHPGVRQAPTTKVSFDDAAGQCKRLGRRLCTAAEWEFACEGPEGLKFPYGNEHEQDRCNEAAATGLAHNLSRGGARNGCVTEAGVLDLVGNVAEWVAEGVARGGDATSLVPTCKSSKKVPRNSASPALGFRCCQTLAR